MKKRWIEAPERCECAKMVIKTEAQWKIDAAGREYKKRNSLPEPRERRKMEEYRYRMEEDENSIYEYDVECLKTKEKANRTKGL